MSVSGQPTPGFLVWRLSMKWRTAVDRATAPLGLSHAHYSLLGSLLSMQSSGRMPSQRELADYCGLEPLYVSKLARALDQAGLISRVPNPADTRAVQLSLTDRGTEIAGRAITIVQQLIINRMPEYDAIFVTPEGKILYSNGLAPPDEKPAATAAPPKGPAPDKH